MKIDYVCFTGLNGFSCAAKNYIEALLDHGCDVKITPIDLGYPKQYYPTDYQRLNSLKDKTYNQNRIQIFNILPDMQRRFKDKMCLRNIGMAVFENDAPPKVWTKILNMNSAVFAPSRFLEKVFKDSGVEKPLFYIPHCIDMNKFYVKERPENKSFRFMFFGSWKERKGGKSLVEAYLKEFSSKDNVELVISGDNVGSIQADILRIRKKFPHNNLPNIIMNEKLITYDEVPNHLRSADCLVSPTMGEGFGLPGLQAMAVGTPIIITNWSGTTEYASEETATLLSPEKFVEIDFLDGIPQFRGQKWAYISVDQIAARMREVYNNKELAKKKAEVGAKLVREKFSYDSVFDRISEAFSELNWLT